MCSYGAKTRQTASTGKTRWKAEKRRAPPLPASFVSRHRHVDRTHVLYAAVEEVLEAAPPRLDKVLVEAAYQKKITRDKRRENVFDRTFAEGALTGVVLLGKRRDNGASDGFLHPNGIWAAL